MTIEVNRRFLAIVIVFVLTIAYIFAFFSRGFEYALPKPETYAVPVLLTLLWWLILGLNHWVRVMVGLDICLGISGGMYVTEWWIFQKLGVFAILLVGLLTLLWVDKYDENKARAAANSAAEPKVV